MSEQSLVDTNSNFYNHLSPEGLSRNATILIKERTRFTVAKVADYLYV